MKLWSDAIMASLRTKTSLNPIRLINTNIHNLYTSNAVNMYNFTYTFYIQMHIVHIPPDKTVILLARDVRR